VPENIQRRSAQATQAFRKSDIDALFKDNVGLPAEG
jgi:hypothetical protein